jgi:hypothetical protein
MATARTRSTTLLVLLLLNVAASIAHYADNIVRFAQYPEPPWINPTRIDVFWFLMTPVGVAAYALYRRGWPRLALALNQAYGAMNLLVLGHYLVAPPWRLSAPINALILVEAAAAICLIAYTARFQLAPDSSPALLGP